jgi:BlaI family transcriptional regulator, penicillinase repressor
MPVSSAESLVMEALWRRSPLSAEEIIAEVAAPQDWSAVTVKTLLNRLLNKGAISAEKDGRRYLYSPVLARADYLQSESEDLIDRLFGGRIAPLVSHFSENRPLSREDIEELKRLIAELDRDQ